MTSLAEGLKLAQGWRLFQQRKHNAWSKYFKAPLNQLILKV